MLFACGGISVAELLLLESEQTESIAQRHTCITVRANVKKCAVFLNGEYQGNTTLTIRELPQGLYHLQVQKSGYLVADYLAAVTDGKHEHYYVVLEKDVQEAQSVQAAQGDLAE